MSEREIASVPRFARRCQMRSALVLDAAGGPDLFSAPRRRTSPASIPSRPAAARAFSRRLILEGEWRLAQH